MKEQEWDQYNTAISVEFTNENLFIEKMKIQLLSDKIESWDSIKEIGGTVMPFKELMKRTFGLTENQVQEYLDEIEDEKKSGKFNIFYELADIELGVEAGTAGLTDAEGNPMTVQDVAAKVYTDPEDFDENPWPEGEYNDENPENQESQETQEQPQEQPQQGIQGVGGFDITKDYSQPENPEEEENAKLQKYLSQFD